MTVDVVSPPVTWRCSCGQCGATFEYQFSDVSDYPNGSCRRGKLSKRGISCLFCGSIIVHNPNAPLVVPAPPRGP